MDSGAAQPLNQPIPRRCEQMPQPSIYFRRETLDWIDEKSSIESRASVVRKAVLFYQNHPDLVDQWNPSQDPDEGKCEFCGNQFAGKRGVEIHKNNCPKRPEKVGSEETAD